ncbi:MAG TPA: hypothetical protein VNY83_05820 [Solirubrobacterales bacterium]|jgi:hypothetical protein|nr:hypothetical protein [Solirubrobacterales bacterium]
MGRKQNDVFVLGDESLAAEPIAARDPDPPAVTGAREPNGESPPAPARPCDPPGGSAAGATRRLAVLGLGAAAAATLGALELSGAGPAHPHRDQTSPRSLLAASPAPSAPAPPTRAAPARPADPQSKPRPRHLTVRRPRRIHHGEPEREPNPEQAPVSSPVQAPAPPPPPVAAPAPAPLPPSPPPPPGGGGSGGRERFGFER